MQDMIKELEIICRWRKLKNFFKIFGKGGLIDLLLRGEPKRREAIAEFVEIADRIMAGSGMLESWSCRYLRDIHVNFGQNAVNYYITVFRPGIFIGRKGEIIDKVRQELIYYMRPCGVKDVTIHIKEWRTPWGWENV